ncbi:MAG: DUF507 family protein [Deltaproteobacteria bacterium]|nr:DUF507 family protein [Deltaproteobacteria bacterium]
MRIRQEQVERACRLILEGLKQKKLITFKSPEAKVYQKLLETFQDNLKEEERIDEEAKRILEECLENSDPNLDRQKMFLMIKRKLAKDKGFIL